MTDLDWFDNVCELLTKEKTPTVHKLTNMIGAEEPNPQNNIRGSKFLIPLDKRFDGSAINPIINDSDKDRQLDNLSFWGKNFNLKLSDVAKRFPHYLTQRNTYDGGTQIFFNPTPDKYEFTAISFSTEKEIEEIKNILEITVHSVTFKFGNNLILLRDGYTMTR